MDLLILMVERRGELITRGEIVERLWGKDVFIEVETAVNTLVRKVRQALRDSSDAPTFVETVPGKGYRFIAPVVVLAGPQPALDRETSLQARPPDPGGDDIAPGAVANVPIQTVDTPAQKTRWRHRSTMSVFLALLVVAGIAAWAWNGTRRDPRPSRLAVLPFETIRVETGREYVADALHEETIAALGQVAPERIEVITRRLTLPYRQTTKPPAQIAQELNADYLVESSIHQEERQVRITARLIRAGDQAQIWTDSYEDEPRSVLEFQRELAARIAEQVQLTLSRDRLDALARRHTANTEAFQLYLQGLEQWNRLTPQTTQRAIGYYTRATQIDPTYALPWTGLALAYAGAPINADADPRQMRTLARQAADAAIGADPRLAEAQTAMGAVNFWFDWDWTSAEKMFRQATLADPKYAFGRRMLGIVLSHQGHHDEAQEHMRGLIKLESTYEMNYTLGAQVAFNSGDYAGAAVFAKLASEFEPNFWIADYHLAMAHERLGEYDSALQALARPLAAGASNSKLHSLRGYVLARKGRAEDAREVLNTLEVMSRARYIPPYARALVHAGLGETPAALDWLERAYEARDVHLIALPTDAKWDPYRSDLRFKSLLQRCGFTGLRGNGESVNSAQ